MTSDLSPLAIFYGDLTVAQAYVYARLPRPAEDAGLSLVGQVRGPRCLQAETLPVTSPLVDLGPGPTLLARAVIPDPCFWSPDLPAIYDVTVHLLRGQEIIATARRELGLRALGVRGRNFALEGKRWILRGVSASSTVATLPRLWREVVASYVTGHAKDDCLAEASQWGSLAVVELDCAEHDAAEQLRRLALHPAVALVVIRGSLPADFKLSHVAPNLLLAQPLSTNQASIGAWAQVLWLETDDPVLAGRIASQTELPIIVVRRLTSPLPLTDARAACDVLQRELASAGQFAGYVV
jgi:hypothetical protein